MAGDGLYSLGIALNSYGTAVGSGRGLYAERAAQNCYGESVLGTGLVTSLAFNCFGHSQTAAGLIFTKTGALCWGERVNPPGFNYVLGGGAAGQVTLP